MNVYTIIHNWKTYTIIADCLKVDGSEIRLESSGKLVAFFNDSIAIIQGVVPGSELK